MQFQLIHHATRETDIKLHSEFFADTLQEAIAHVTGIPGLTLQQMTLWVLPLRYVIPLDNPEALSNIMAWMRLGARL